MIRPGAVYEFQAQGSDLLIEADIGSLLLLGVASGSFNPNQSIVLG